MSDAAILTFDISRPVGPVRVRCEHSDPGVDVFFDVVCERQDYIEIAEPKEFVDPTGGIRRQTRYTGTCKICGKVYIFRALSD